MIGTNEFPELFFCAYCFIVSGSEIVLVTSLSQPVIRCGVSRSGRLQGHGLRNTDLCFLLPRGLEGRAHLWSPIPSGFPPAAWAPALCSDLRMTSAPLIPGHVDTDPASVLLPGEQTPPLRCLGHVCAHLPLEGQPVKHRTASEPMTLTSDEPGVISLSAAQSAHQLCDLESHSPSLSSSFFLGLMRKIYTTPQSHPTIPQCFVLFWWIRNVFLFFFLSLPPL